MAPGDLSTSQLNQIVKALKTQADRRHDIISKGSQVINPQNMLNSTTATFGPFLFGTSFPTRPNIAFGQVRMQQQQVTTSFVVMPYVDSWIVSSGGVQGFVLGALPLVPVPLGLIQHTVSWVAIGKASLYKSDNTNENWNSSYNVNQSSHLNLADGALEKNN